MPALKLSEYKLIKSIRDGDKEAFRILFDQYYSPLCSYAATLVKFSEVAEEIVQETLIRLWENRSHLNIDVSLRAYLYRSIHNNCISYIRSLTVQTRRSKRITEEITYHAELASRNYTEDILDNIVSGELEMHLARAVGELPGQCQKIFCMCRYENHTYQEIADQLGISVNTVKTQLSRAFERLRQSLEDLVKN